MSNDWFSPLLRAELAELRAYEPVQHGFDVRLDANEAPCLLSPEARDALARAMVPREPNRYPDARAIELRRAIAARCDAEPDEVLVGVGSDEVIALLLTALDRPRGRAPAPTIVTPTPTFVMYRLSARARGFKVVEVPLDAAWDLDVAGMRRAIELARPNVVFVASPNNPTGAMMSEDRLRAVIEAAPDAFVIVDEAYVDFAPRAQAALRQSYGHVGILRTLSKIGLASLRVGWLLAPAPLVREIDKVRQPYNVPEPSQRGAAFALRELGDELRAVAGEVVRAREALAAELGARGFSVAPSDANFLWVETPRAADEIAAALAARGVLVKSFGARGGRLARRLRITVGTERENARLLEELAACG
ncbi:MAG TPA: histidinol-phosphate transaminase [Minicystis sp.]|nr:histidinol-phosphate transaminase [Minicystis sp.]